MNNVVPAISPLDRLLLHVVTMAVIGHGVSYFDHAAHPVSSASAAIADDHRNPQYQAAAGKHSQNPKLTGLAPNTALLLAPYKPSPLEGCGAPAGTITDYSRLTYDSTNHQILMFGGGHSAAPRSDVDAFNLTTLTWRSAYPSTPVSEMTVANLNHDLGSWKTTGHPTSRHTYDMLTFAPNLGELILLKQTDTQPSCIERYQWERHPGKVWHYNPATRQWKASAASPVWRNFLTASEYDPVSGQIILIDQYGLYSYDPVAQVAARHQSFARGDLGYSQNLVYFPPNGKMYYIKNDGAVFEVNLDRTNLSNSTILLVSGTTGTQPSGGETGWAYDSVNAIIGGGITKGVFYAFDPVARTWAARTMQVTSGKESIGTLAFHCIDYDPVNNVFIFLDKIGIGGGSYVYKTWAYRYGGRSVVARGAPAPLLQSARDTRVR